MNDEQVKYMVNRFLAWKLPRDTFNPDCGISFDKGPINAHAPYPSRYEPVGTNLFDAQQAEAMVRFMIEGMPQTARTALSATPTPADGWRDDMENAPKDGTPIDLLADGRRYIDCRWGRFDAESEAPFGPEHWRGLPTKAGHVAAPTIEPTHWRYPPPPPGASPKPAGNAEVVEAK